MEVVWKRIKIRKTSELRTAIAVEWSSSVRTDSTSSVLLVLGIMRTRVFQE